MLAYIHIHINNYMHGNLNIYMIFIGYINRKYFKLNFIIILL